MDLKETGRVDPNKFWYYVYKSKFIVDETLKIRKIIDVLFVVKKDILRRIVKMINVGKPIVM